MHMLSELAVAHKHMHRHSLLDSSAINIVPIKRASISNVTVLNEGLVTNNMHELWRQGCCMNAWLRPCAGCTTMITLC